MATILQLQFLIIAMLCMLCILYTNAESSDEASSTTVFPFATPPSIFTSPSQAPSLVTLESILKNLGFEELAGAVSSLYDSTFYFWSGPLTIFAPTDTSIRSCEDSCSISQLLREHMVPGIFSSDYLKRLSFGTKIETMNTGRCITVTSGRSGDGNDTIVYIGGLEITRPDFFYNGLLVVHRLEGLVAPLSPFSCHIERISPLFISPSPQTNEDINVTKSHVSTAMMNLMLKDVMQRLHSNGFTLLSLALRLKQSELVSLQNFTVFAVNDTVFFSCGHAYLNNFGFHVVPNRLLMSTDLMIMPEGTLLPTMDPAGDALIVTTGGKQGSLKINYIEIEVPNVVYNMRIVVHCVLLPFPHPSNMDFTNEFGGLGVGNSKVAAVDDDNALVKLVKLCADDVLKGSGALVTSKNVLWSILILAAVWAVNNSFLTIGMAWIRRTIGADRPAVANG